MVDRPKGWVYVITNPAMSGICKVGYSLRDPAIRAAELNHTGSPQPYDVGYEAMVTGAFEIEQQAHDRLARVHAGKEWFRCTVEEAVAAIRAVAAGKVLYENYPRNQQHRSGAFIKRTPNVAFMKLLQPDAALAAIVGFAPLPRTDIVSKLWAYTPSRPRKHKARQC